MFNCLLFTVPLASAQNLGHRSCSAARIPHIIDISCKRSALAASLSPLPSFVAHFYCPPPLLLAMKINHRDTGVCKTGKKKIHRRVQKCRHGPMQEEYQTCKWGKTCVLIFVFKCLFDIWRLMFVHLIFYCHSKLQWEKCFDISYGQT